MTPESAVLKAVCELLAAERIPHFRMNVGAVKAGKRFFRFGTPGMADVVAFPWKQNSWFANTLWIECKAAKGRQTSEQEGFEAYVISNGMSYIVARSSDDVLQWLRDNGVKR